MKQLFNLNHKITSKKHYNLKKINNKLMCRPKKIAKFNFKLINLLPIFYKMKTNKIMQNLKFKKSILKCKPLNLSFPLNLMSMI